MHINDLTVQDFVKYLKTYVAPIEWEPHLDQLFHQLNIKATNASMARAAARSQAAFTILYPTVDATSISDPPEKMLFWAGKNPQLGSRDWCTELCKVIEEDRSIKLIRDELATLGTVNPVYSVPRWRQAFYKLMDEVERSGLDGEDKSLHKGFEFLVQSYGGTVVNSLFQPQFVKQIGKILNWRTPYFFERMIHRVHKKDELIKIKTLDIQEIHGSDPTKIVQIRFSTERKEEAGADDF